MNAVTPIIFASAYRQLQPSEKLFVDGYVRSLEHQANKDNERISNALYRAIPVEVIEASRGMLHKPMVIAAINERVIQIAADTELTANRVLKELMAISFASMADYGPIGEDGRQHHDLSGCTPEQLSAIKSLEYEEATMRKPGKCKITLHDKLAGLDKLMRYMGLLDPENPFWKADTARPKQAALELAATVTDEAAADTYARMIH